MTEPRDNLARLIETKLFGTTDGDLLPDEDTSIPIGEIRRLIHEEAVPALLAAYPQLAATAPSADPATIKRVARAMFVAEYGEHDRLWLRVRDEYERHADVAVRALQGEA